MQAKRTIREGALGALWRFGADYLTVQPEQFMDVNHGNSQSRHPFPMAVEHLLQLFTEGWGLIAEIDVVQATDPAYHSADITVHWQSFFSPPVGHDALRHLDTHTLD
jgi:hypothetical protein